jgi:hypothetical protein
MLEEVPLGILGFDSSLLSSKTKIFCVGRVNFYSFLFYKLAIFYYFTLFYITYYSFVINNYYLSSLGFLFYIYSFYGEVVIVIYAFLSFLLRINGFVIASSSSISSSSSSSSSSDSDYLFLFFLKLFFYIFILYKFPLLSVYSVGLFLIILPSSEILNEGSSVIDYVLLVKSLFY